MTSLLIELYDRHTIEKNVYQAFVSDCDEILYLSTRKIAEEEKLSLKHFLMEQVPHLKQVHFRQFHLEKICQELDVFINDFDTVTIDVFGGDNLLAIVLYQYGFKKGIPIIAMDVEQGKQYAWERDKIYDKKLEIPSLSIEQLIALRGGKVLKSRRPQHSNKQVLAIKNWPNMLSKILKNGIRLPNSLLWQKQMIFTLKQQKFWRVMERFILTPVA